MQEVCPDCTHMTGMHFDERGCHVENCRCTEYYLQPTQKFRGYKKEIKQREVANNDFLGNLWVEIKEWHGDPLNQKGNNEKSKCN